MRCAAILGLALLAFAGSAVAQTAIGVREVVNGSLDAQDQSGADGRLYDCYRLAAEPDRWMAASAISRSFDAVIEAGRGSSCAFEADTVADDFGSGSDARAHLSPGDEDWFIRVTTYAAGAGGQYHFWISPAEGPPESPVGGANPFPNGTAERVLPVSAENWVRPDDPRLRSHWDAMCVAVNWAVRHEQIPTARVPPDQIERETALLAAALTDSGELSGDDAAGEEAAWRAWTGAVVTPSHDGMLVLHPVAEGLQRACVKQLPAAGDG